MDDKNDTIEQLVSDLDYTDPERSAKMYMDGFYKPRKLIVLVGIWILMGGTIFVCGFVVVGFIWSTLSDLSIVNFENFKDNIGEFVILMFFFAMLIFSIIVLYKSTKRYFNEKKRMQEHNETDE